MVLSNGLGHYDHALAAAGQASAYPADVGPANWGLVELIEAAARAGSPERETGAMLRLSESTGVSGTDWALGIETRSRALLSEGEAADRLHCEAIERLGRTPMRAELARAHLLYGAPVNGTAPSRRCRGARTRQWQAKPGRTTEPSVGPRRHRVHTGQVLPAFDVVVAARPHRK